MLCARVASIECLTATPRYVEAAHQATFALHPTRSHNHAPLEFMPFKMQSLAWLALQDTSVSRTLSIYGNILVILEFNSAQTI